MKTLGSARVKSATKKIFDQIEFGPVQLINENSLEYAEHQLAQVMQFLSFSGEPVLSVKVKTYSQIRELPLEIQWNSGTNESQFCAHELKRKIIPTRSYFFYVATLNINQCEVFFSQIVYTAQWILPLLLLIAFLLRYLERIRNLQKSTEAELSDRLVVVKQVEHDIKSPIAALKVIGSSSREQDGLFTSAVQRIEKIVHSLGTSTSSSNNVQSTAIRLSLSPVEIKSGNSLQQILDSITKEKMILFPSVSIDFEFDPALRNCKVANGIDVLERIISNLINNSIEASFDQRGSIKIQVEATKGQTLKIRISDNGIGIPPHVITKIGNYGYSYGKSGNPTAGSGLGVWHAKNEIERSKGRFQISSIVAPDFNHGTTIEIELPLNSRIERS
jgi:signal transduction histidine kinase